MSTKTSEDKAAETRETDKTQTSEAKEVNTSETAEQSESKIPSLTADQSDSASVEDPNPSVKTKKGTNYSREEIKKLLTLLQDVLPVTESDWEELTAKFNENCSFNRTSGSLKNKFTVLSGNSGYYDIINGLKKAIRDKSIQTGENIDPILSGFILSDAVNNASGPQSPENEVQEVQEEHVPEAHPTRRRKTKGTAYVEAVPEEPQPPQKIVSLDPLSEISLSMAILARAQVEKSALPSFGQGPLANHPEEKTDCKNNIHHYLVAPSSAFIFCRSCGKIIKFDDGKTK